MLPNILGIVIREVGDPKKPSSIKRNDRVFLNTARILIDGDFLGGSNPQMGTMGIYIYIYIANYLDSLYLGIIPKLSNFSRGQIQVNVDLTNQQCVNWNIMRNKYQQ